MAIWGVNKNMLRRHGIAFDVHELNNKTDNVWYIRLTRRGLKSRECLLLGMLCAGACLNGLFRALEKNRHKAFKMWLFPSCKSGRISLHFLTRNTVSWYRQWSVDDGRPRAGANSRSERFCTCNNCFTWPILFVFSYAEYLIDYDVRVKMSWASLL